MDAKKQCSKLCVLDQGQEVRHNPVRDTFIFTLVDIFYETNGVHKIISSLFSWQLGGENKIKNIELRDSNQSFE